ncbi:MAG: trigger factor [Nitrospiraceae bacterium]|nr:MAG: trigger factor [Nitrospiraceae bacterium]
MLQQVEEISPTRKRLKISVPSDVIKSETDLVYNKIRTTTKIPGFRPGKAPQAILEKRFSKDVEAQVIEKVVPQFYLKALMEAKLEPVTYPDIEEKMELTPGQPLSFTVTVEVKPEIGDLSYEGIILKEGKTGVEEEDVDKTVELMRETRSLFSVTEDALNENDMAVISYDAYFEDKLMEDESHKDFPLILNSREMPEEFCKALTGKKKGDNAEVKIKYADSHLNKNIAGKEVLFKIVITEGKKKNVPPLNDDFATEAGFSSLEEMKNKIREGLSERKKSQMNLAYKKEILNELIKRHDFDVPVSMLRGEIESLIYQTKQDAGRSGEPVKPEEELAKELEPVAKDNVKSVILLEAIGRKEKIEISDDDIRKAVDEIAVRNNLKPEEVMRLYAVREGSMDAMKSRLFADKVLEFILEKATIKTE